MTRQPATAGLARFAVKEALMIRLPEQTAESLIRQIEAEAAAPQPAEAVRLLKRMTNGDFGLLPSELFGAAVDALANQPAADPATHDIGGPATYPDDFPANQPAAEGLDGVAVAERVISTIENALEDEAPEWLEAAFADAIEAERRLAAAEQEEGAG